MKDNNLSFGNSADFFRFSNGGTLPPRIVRGIKKLKKIEQDSLAFNKEADKETNEYLEDPEGYLRRRLEKDRKSC
ncbi:MAG: hypothetical protein RIQ54_559 [Candidatus Parcubacteria bacterium]